MVETARALAAAGLTDKTIVLTGAMVPYAFGSSDGLFNLGSALSFAQVLPPGVYVAMNGQYFTWDSVRKNRETGVFESTPMITLESKLPSVGTTIFTVMSRLAAELGAINLSQGFPGLRLRSGARRAPSRAHMRERREPVRADAGRAAAARGDRGEVRSAVTGGRYDPETEITVTSGGTEAIFDAVAAASSGPATRSSSSSPATTRTCRRSS